MSTKKFISKENLEVFKEELDSSFATKIEVEEKQDALEFNVNVPAGITPTNLTILKSDDDYYKIPEGTKIITFTEKTGTLTEEQLDDIYNGRAIVAKSDPYRTNRLYFMVDKPSIKYAQFSMFASREGYATTDNSRIVQLYNYRLSINEQNQHLAYKFYEEYLTFTRVDINTAQSQYATEGGYATSLLINDRSGQANTRYKISKVDGNPTIPSGTTPTNLSTLKINDDYYKLPTGVNPVIETTWSDLKTLRDGGNLIPGQLYRITDYTCTTVQSDTRSAGHVFDILIRADDASHLNEKCWAAHHTGDTYFANCKLEAWQLWYSLDNDTTRFAWADSTNGKGVIYRMIDEFNNDVPYDFKNILMDLMWYYPQGNSKVENKYTFSYWEGGDVYADGSLVFEANCYNNKINAYFNNKLQTINKIIFNAGFKLSVTPMNCYENIFESNCHDIGFGFHSAHNVFKNSCTQIFFSGDANSNIFNVGDYCIYAAQYASSNSFGSGCHSIYLHGSDMSNSFGSSCSNIRLGQNSSKIIFKGRSEFINYYTSYGVSNVKNIIFDDECSNIDLTTSDTSSKYLQNVYIHAGVKGKNANQRLTIDITARGQDFTTDIYKSGSKTIILD